MPMLRPQPSGALLPSYEGARRASLAEDYDYEAGFAVGEQAPGMGLYTEALAELCRRELGSSAACEQGPLEPGSEAYSEQLRRALIQAQRRQTPFDAPPPALQLARHVPAAPPPARLARGALVPRGLPAEQQQHAAWEVEWP